MGKKMKVPSLLNNSEVKSSSSWPWLYCNQPRTLSFRDNNCIFKTINPVYLNATNPTMDVVESSESLFTISPDSNSFSTTSEASRRGQDSTETVIRESRSDRLFFELDETSSILEAKSGGRVPFKDSVAFTMDSQDPYVDFRRSMEEIVETHGVKDWKNLEQIFCWYLRVNEKSSHGYIVSAFVDLLVNLEFVPASSSSSSYSTPCVSSLEAEEEVDSTTSSSLLFEQVKEVIKHEDEKASSSSSDVSF
ncbi:hypothetical protein TanjilG_19628 [Lupinus angustifolius]|uniref:Transcription repressor n=1 Tax=Lupinus angustifolius TaxID=3871 RepID=A0A1J7HFE9_LUPAN|nr:PREDICTED: transcription repressor OFP13-like [Lupinus angustifolius]OIW11372.1 hypothetical protein TanjilG_19628 [Lupinus angustifolius]